MTKTKRLLTRKDIADLLDVTTDQVRRNEAAWGLTPARCDLNSRCVRYRATQAETILKAKGFLE